MKVFEVIKSCFSKAAQEYYLVNITLDAAKKYQISNIYGSLHVLQARLFDMNYHDYLKMERDVFHATLFGRCGIYIVSRYKNKEDAEKLARELNKRVLAAAKEWEKVEEI
jgi:hypothetical protein